MKMKSTYFILAVLFSSINFFQTERKCSKPINDVIYGKTTGRSYIQ